QVLGLRLVKRTVNFDDPGSYHFYFGDHTGAPGTILTFFAWPQATRGRRGVGETSAITFSVPANSLQYWEEHLRNAGVALQMEQRFGTTVLRFTDGDGTPLEISEGNGTRRTDIPNDHAIRGFGSVTVAEASSAEPETVLAAMGWSKIAEEGNRRRWAAPESSAQGRYIDLVHDESGTGGRMGAGSVHHIAFRAEDDDDQLRWQNELTQRGLHVTPVMDRTYFHSIYFREPGGVLFEIATDGPGFAFDEPVESLGESLKLPPWLEKQRQSIEASLPRIHLTTKAVAP
ncbi:MAG: ring-cleaving dioxygenase, partial [Rhodospirillales bacterium]|nr:ring-cleaving dioxygenase [Acetobacter sp.]